MKKRNSYYVYLLRCWQEDGANSKGQFWRFSLERVQDNQRHGFADLEALLAFLQQITQLGNDSDVTVAFFQNDVGEIDDSIKSINHLKRS